MDVVIDGVSYVPRSLVEPISDEALKRALKLLVDIQYFPECAHKHRAWAWDALNALSPDIAALAADNPKAAFSLLSN
jgi:hypothetical protein